MACGGMRLMPTSQSTAPKLLPAHGGKRYIWDLIATKNREEQVEPQRLLDILNNIVPRYMELYGIMCSRRYSGQTDKYITVIKQL